MELLGGGIEQGSSTLVLGPAGSGKTTLVWQFVAEAVRRGDKAAMFVFDEELGLMFDRAKPLGFDFAAMQTGGRGGGGGLQITSTRCCGALSW